MECGIKTDQSFRDENTIEATTTEAALHIKVDTIKMEAATTRRSAATKIVKVMRVILSVKMTLMSSSRDKKGGRSITACRTGTLQTKLKITMIAI